jgi:hypothetical protein
MPLGLITIREGGYSLLTDDELVELPVIKKTIFSVAGDGQETVAMGAIQAAAAAAPFGLTRESCYLLLSALVAQKHFEFVTSNGNRIHYRSLDLQIDWQDIAGIARPASQAYTGDQLLRWAARLTGDETLVGDRSADARARVIEALNGWLTNWKCSAVLARFDELPDANLNSKFWRLANSVRKSFGMAADHIDALVNERGSLDSCLQNIADTFGDSEKEFDQKMSDLKVLESTINLLPDLERLRSYVTASDPTGDASTDSMRSRLINDLAVLAPQDLEPAAALLASGTLFKRQYSEQYTLRHNAALNGKSLEARLDEFLRSDLWTLFNSLSVLPVFDQHDMDAARDIIRVIKGVGCTADVPDVLEAQPVCICGFKIGSGSEGNQLISKLSSIVATTLKRVSQLLIANRTVLSGSLGEELLNSFDDAVHGRGGIPKLSGNQVRSLAAATRDLAVTDNHIVIEPHPFESLSDALLENELGRMETHR